MLEFFGQMICMRNLEENKKTLQEILQILNQYATISEAAKAVLPSILIEKHYKKGNFLLKEGKICRNLHIVKTGFIRAFYNDDGKEMTTGFAFENDFCMSISSFIAQNPSFENFETMEDVATFSIDYDNLQMLYKTFPEFNQIGRLLTERYYIELENRSRSLQFFTAKKRYQQLLEEQPQLLQRVSLGHIASFLGISQETLSRIRGKN